MKQDWFIGVSCTILCACSADKVPGDCIYPAGKLLFDTEKITWQDVHFGEEYRDTVKVYNPTRDAIRLEGLNHFTEVQIQPIGGTSNAWRMGGKEIPAGACDTLVVTFHATDDSLLGDYYNVLRFIVDGEVDYAFGVKIEANVLENFEAGWEGGDTLRPRMEILSREYDFGTIQSGDEIPAVFQITNTGSSNLLIRKIETMCGCTAVTAGKRVVEPGTTMELEVVFHSIGRSGAQHKQVTLFCNDPRQPVVKLVVRGEVKALK